MQKIRPLDAIIRKLPAPPKVLPTSEKVVMIDCKSRKAVASKPWFSWFTEVSYFLVVNRNGDINPAEYDLPTIPVKDIENDRSIGLNLRCWISSPEGNEMRVAEALCDPEHSPSDVFDRLIKRWVDEFVGPDRQNFIHRYFEIKRELQSRIVARALSEIGLDLQLKIYLEGESASNEIIKLTTEIFLVRVKDYHEQQDLRINCQLQIEPATRIYANVYRHRAGQLKSVIISEALKFFEHKVTLEQFYDDLNHEAIIEPLKKALNARLQREGREVGFFHLESTASDSALTQFEADLDVKVKVQEYPEQITIKNHVRMKRRNVAIYKSKGSPKLDTWLTQQLNQIIPDVLFYEKYIDLLIDFRRPEDDVEARSSLKKTIKHKLSVEAEKIGYEIKYLTTIPALKPLTWLEPFTINVDGSFETKESNFFVKLSIPITLRLETLDDAKIRGLLNGQRDIPELMREKALSVTSQYLHKIDPEQFYTTFLFANEAKYEGQRAVEQEIISIITDSLQNSFASQVISVVPKIVDTEPIIRWRELQEKVCDFRFEVTPLRGGEPVLFSGKFQVDSIASDGWYKFQSRKFTVDEIQKYLEDYVRAQLKTAAKDELLYKGRGHLTALYDEISKTAKSGIEKVYGVVISLSMIDREFTQTESEINTEIIERDRSAILIAQEQRIASARAAAFFAEKKEEEVRLLIEERLRLGADAPEDQIKEFEDRIKVERDRLKPDLIPSIESVESILRPHLPGEDRLIDMARYRSLTAGPDANANHNNQNGEHGDE
jgi:hypothetical protein